MTTPNFAVALSNTRQKRDKALQQVAQIDAQIDRMIQDAKAAGLTNATIGRHLGISAEAVAKRLARSGARSPRKPAPSYGLPVEWKVARKKDQVLLHVADEREPYRVEPAYERALGEPEPTLEQITSVVVRRGYGSKEVALTLTAEQHDVLLEEYRKMLRIQENRAAGQAKRKQTLGYGMGRSKR
jgi:hypothetical protein